MENSLDLKNFNDACDSFLLGKYILAQNKISSILRTINESEKLKNIIASCIEDYNFASSFEKSIGENQIITLPDDAKGIIAFVFSLLYNIENCNIDFYDFLNKFYGYDELTNVESFKTFATNLILPFKEAMNNVYVSTHILVDSKDYQSNIYNKLKKICEFNKNNIEQFKLKDINKEELLSLLNCMIDACIKNDKETVYALLIAFDYFSSAHKKTKLLFEQLKECFEK